MDLCQPFRVSALESRPNRVGLSSTTFVADASNQEGTLPKSEMIESFAPAAVTSCEDCGDIVLSGEPHDCASTLADVVEMSSPDGEATTIVGGSYVAPLGPPGHLGTRNDVQDELDRMARAIRAFYVKPPDMVMRECSAYGARLTELQVLLHRVESVDRQYTRVRTQQVERFLNEIERQYRIASRLVEVQRQDIHLAGGHP